MFSEPPKRTIPADEFIIDFVLGCCSELALLFGLFALYDVPSASAGEGRFLLYGGAITVAFLYLALGNSRGESEGNLWIKALCICGAILMSTANAGRLFFEAAALTFPAAVLGLWLRRRGFVVWRMRSILPTKHLE